MVAVDGAATVRRANCVKHTPAARRVRLNIIACVASSLQASRPGLVSSDAPVLYVWTVLRLSWVSTMQAGP